MVTTLMNHESQSQIASDFDLEFHSQLNIAAFTRGILQIPEFQSLTKLAIARTSLAISKSQTAYHEFAN